MHQMAELLVHLSACPTDATVDLAPPLPPSLLPESHGERPVCDLCTKTFTTQKTLKRQQFVLAPVQTPLGARSPTSRHDEI